MNICNVYLSSSHPYVFAVLANLLIQQFEKEEMQEKWLPLVLLGSLTFLKKLYMENDGEMETLHLALMMMESLHHDMAEKTWYSMFSPL